LTLSADLTNPFFLQGDSGGPMMVKNVSGKFVLAGIVSFGAICESVESTPGIYQIFFFFADISKS